MATIQKVIGRVPVSRGTYSAGNTYYQNNLVQYLGSTYMCTADGTTDAPATEDAEGTITTNAGWELWADATAVREYGKRLDNLQTQVDGIEESAGSAATAAAAAAANVERHDRDFGYYGEAGTIALSVAQSGKYINTSGAEVANTSYAISAPVSVKRGSIYLIKASSAVSTSVALVSRMVSTEYTALIIYDYTYDEQGRVLTATAQYDKTLVYTYSYDDEGNATITDKDGGEVESLPATREVVENTYEPLFRAASGKMPLSGYYVFACTEDMDVYISNREPDMATPMIEVSYGVLTSFMTSIGNLQAQVDAIEESTMPQAESAYQSVEGIAAAMQGAVPDYPSVPLLCGQPAKLFGAGAPSSDVVPVNWKQYDEGGYNWNGMPTALGQEYFDTSADTGGHYTAVPAEPRYTSVGIQHNVSELRWMNV